MTFKIGEMQTLTDLDDADIKAIIAVQLADLDEALQPLLASESKGKRRVGAPTNSTQQALQSYRQYLEDIETNFADNKLAQSIDKALDEDTKIIAQLLAEDQTAINDRKLAFELSGKRFPENSDAFSFAGLRKGLDAIEDSIDVFNLPFFTESQEQHGTPGADPRLGLGYATSSGTTSKPRPAVAASAAATSLVRETKCCTCMEVMYCITAPCSDTYCHKCIKELFMRACIDETLWVIPYNSCSPISSPRSRLV